MKKYYDYLEQHQDGSYWYHGMLGDINNETKEQAENAFKEHFNFDLERPHVIIEHTYIFPDITLFTKDFKVFIDLKENIVIEDNTIKVLTIY